MCRFFLQGAPPPPGRGSCSEAGGAPPPPRFLLALERLLPRDQLAPRDATGGESLISLDCMLP